MAASSSLTRRKSMRMSRSAAASPPEISASTERSTGRRRAPTVPDLPPAGRFASIPPGNRQPLVELFQQFRQFNRLGEVIVHAGGKAHLGLAAQRVGRAGDDRGALAAVGGLEPADAARKLVAIHLRHVAVGDDDPESPRLPLIQCFDAVFGALRGIAQRMHLAHRGACGWSGGHPPTARAFPPSRLAPRSAPCGAFSSWH